MLLAPLTSLRSKWAVGRRGRVNIRSIRNRRATRPPAHFQRNPPGGRGCFCVACSTRMTQIRALRSRLEKQPTDLRRRHHYLRRSTAALRGIGLSRDVLDLSQPLIESRMRFAVPPYLLATILAYLAYDQNGTRSVSLNFGGVAAE